MTVLGIDVSKTTLDVALFDGRKFKTKVFGNTPRAVSDLVQWLASHQASGCAIGMEATGPYWEMSATVLHDAGHAVSVINPAQVHAFADAELSRAKTDVADAKRIARFVQVHQPPRWVPPPVAVRTLQALVRRLDAVLDLRQQESNRLDVAHASVHLSIQSVLQALDEEIVRLRKAIADHIDQDPDLRQRRGWLESIPGISTRTSAVVLSHMDAFARCATAKQWVAYAGLDCAIVQSGTSVRRRAAISKRGSAQLRRALYFPAMVALKHNPIIRTFGERLKSNGKRGKVLLCAAMR
ncbi:MAG: transposase, partial [Dokdonella sp.]